MSKNKFQKLSENIVNYIGSKDNVTYFVHCVTIDEDLDVSVKKEKKKLTMKGAFSAIADIISGSLIPFIPVLIGAGMIKVLCLLLSTFGILDPASSTYNMLSIVGDV